MPGYDGEVPGNPDTGTGPLNGAEKGVNNVHVFLQIGVWDSLVNERELKKGLSQYLEVPDYPEKEVNEDEPFLHVERGESNSYEFIGSTGEPEDFLDKFENMAEVMGYDLDDIGYRRT